MDVTGVVSKEKMRMDVQWVVFVEASGGTGQIPILVYCPATLKQRCF